MANFNEDTVSILLGDGHGGFGPQVKVDVGDSPNSVLVGDFNGDGLPDLATANFASNDVSVLLGNGDGSFRAQMRYGVGSGPRSVAVADFNGNARLDLATANSGSNDVSVLLGDGAGAFAPQLRFAVGRGPGGLTVGDFDRHAGPDLAVSSRSDNTVNVLLNRGFAVHFRLSAPVWVAAGQSFLITLTARDARGRVVSTYEGTVHIRSSDPDSRLPADYTFTSGDAGRHTFRVTLSTRGWQTVGFSDTFKPLLNGRMFIRVFPVLWWTLPGQWA